MVDTHNHCEFSFDGKRTTAHRSAQSAFEKGLDGIVFTDHYDIYIPDVPGEELPKPQDFDITAQQNELERINSLFPDSFKVLKGIEIGLNPNSVQQARSIIENHSFDQVIASVHYLEDSDPYYGAYFEGKDFKQAYGLYLEALYEGITSLKDFDIAGHFDYVARYAPYPQDCVRYAEFSDIFDSLLKYLIENGKALEINTKSCVSSKGRATVPDMDLLKRYRQMGGETVSLGSDSHTPDNVADRFDVYADMLRSAGFRWTSHYEKRQLVQLPL
jgi:histidinol-phosphatase (PHP family)